MIGYIQMAEFRARLVSAMPQCVARIALLDDDGSPVADAMFTAFSPETWQKIKELEQSVERDFMNQFQTKTETEGEEDEPEDFNWGGSSQF
jgi:hypothetical protein